MENTGSSTWNLPVRPAVYYPSSPYFLHHYDNPGIMLVSQPLIGDNFASWSREMKIALSVKNKFGFIDGSIPKPSESEPNLMNAWSHNNNIVISWLLNSVSKDISASIPFTESAAEIWNDLKDKFKHSHGPRIFHLHHDLLNLSGVNNVKTYVQMNHTMTFRMGLNDLFTHIRSQVLLHDLLPPISRVFALIVPDERQREIGGNQGTNLPNQGMAFTLKADHTQAQLGSRKTQNQKGRPYCTTCNVPGHTVDTLEVLSTQ
ncbi:uncharacterized protein [Primulina huaijiensis]|uniref:uncharacterized protein n=1 Tax=Primulina huaijiensis TaxID=1492673 RepID=UPI003CC6F4BE